MEIHAAFMGTYESLWVMNVNQEDYEEYITTHEDYDDSSNEENTKMWEYFKAKGYYDEPMESQDLTNELVGLDVY